MTALELDFGFDSAAELADRKVRRAVEDAVSVLSLSVAAGACGCTAAQLRDALDGRNGRRLSSDWVMRIARKVGGDYRDRIMDAQNEFMDPGAAATDQAFIAALIEGYAGFGEFGAQQLAAIRRRCKR